MKIIAPDLMNLHVIDGVVPEPVGGAHRDHAASARNVGHAIQQQLNELCSLSLDELIERRQDKYRHIGPVG